MHVDYFAGAFMKMSFFNLLLCWGKIGFVCSAAELVMKIPAVVKILFDSVHIYLKTGMIMNFWVHLASF